MIAIFYFSIQSGVHGLYLERGSIRVNYTYTCLEKIDTWLNIMDSDDEPIELV